MKYECRLRKNRPVQLNGKWYSYGDVFYTDHDVSDNLIECTKIEEKKETEKIRIKEHKIK